MSKYTLKVDDTIKCSNKDEAIRLMEYLKKEHIEAKFSYEKDGEKGVWLVVTKVLKK